MNPAARHDCVREREAVDRASHFDAAFAAEGCVDFGRDDELRGAAFVLLECRLERVFAHESLARTPPTADTDTSLRVSHRVASMLLQLFAESGELALPEPLDVVRDPFVDFVERIGIEAIDALAPATLVDDEAGEAENAQVLRDRGERHVELAGDL